MNTNENSTRKPSFIVLHIDKTDNAAFVDGAGREHEIARILDEAASSQKVEEALTAGRSTPQGIVLFDLNGNRVGQIAMFPTRPAAAPAPGAVRLVLDNSDESMTSSLEGMERIRSLLRLAAAGLREGEASFPLALLDEHGVHTEYGEVIFVAPETELQNGRIDLADHFFNQGVRKADGGYSGIADGEYRYVVGVGDFEFGYGLDAGPVYLVNAKGEVADGYENGDQVVRETFTSTLPRDEWDALRAVADGTLSFEAFEERFGDHEAEDDEEPEV